MSRFNLSCPIIDDSLVATQFEEKYCIFDYLKDKIKEFFEQDIQESKLLCRKKEFDELG